VLTEEDRFWVNLGPGPFFIKDGEEFLWTSERSGFRHIYRYSSGGRLLAQLTSGDWEVTEIAGVDERGGQVYFISTEAGPLERQLYRVSLDGGARTRITAAAGTHAVSVAPACQYLLDTVSRLRPPPRRVLLDPGGAERAVVDDSGAAVLEDFDLLPAEIVSVTAPDGVALYARLIRPAGFEAGREYPAVVFVYGGPHSQNVRDLWQGPSLEQVLAHRGFVVWQLDNRGSAGRGHAWESALYREFGAKELADQQEGVRHLVSMGFVEASRLGVYGWSYGGFLTLYSLLHAPELFRAGVAGAPVTDWRNYDTIYTERYLGLPSENPEGYRRSSPVFSAANLRSRLLLIHNLQDDNVLFQNTVQMADALQRAGRPFEMMIYPQRTHGVTGTARQHLWATIVEFFERTLAP
jgi:dipeptidyl-peptidase-4